MTNAALHQSIAGIKQKRAAKASALAERIAYLEGIEASYRGDPPACLSYVGSPLAGHWRRGYAQGEAYKETMLDAYAEQFEDKIQEAIEAELEDDEPN